MPAQRLWTACSLRTPATLIMAVSFPAMFSSLFRRSENVFQEGGGHVQSPRIEDNGENAASRIGWIACEIIGGCSCGCDSSGEGAVCGSGLKALRGGRRKHHNRRPGKLWPHQGASEE